MFKELSQEVLKKIEEKHIKPKPRWTFLLKDYAVWILGALALFSGGLAFAVVIYMVKNNDWEVYKNINGSLPQFVVLTMPYFWLIFLAVFILVAHYNFKHTKTGYRYRLPAVIGVSIVLSIGLGGFLYGAGVGRAIDDVLSENAPGFYRVFVNRRLDMWARPERGLLLGLITTVNNPQEFELLDFERRTWAVSAFDAAMPPFIKIESGGRIKMIGEKTGENAFHAVMIMPVGPGRGMMRHPEFMHGVMPPGPGFMMRGDVGLDSDIMPPAPPLPPDPDF